MGSPLDPLVSVDSPAEGNPHWLTLDLREALVRLGLVELDQPLPGLPATVSFDWDEALLTFTSTDPTDTRRVHVIVVTADGTGVHSTWQGPMVAGTVTFDTTSASSPHTVVFSVN